jgi:hypothetical protein
MNASSPSCYSLPLALSFTTLCLHPIFKKSQTISYGYVFIYRISSTMATSGRTTAVKGGTGTQSTPANNVGETRRVCSLSPILFLNSVLQTEAVTNGSSTQGSNSGGGLFSGLMNQKRNSTDAAAAARRQSFHDQKPQAGFLGQMWHKYVVRLTNLES